MCVCVCMCVWHILVDIFARVDKTVYFKPQVLILLEKNLATFSIVLGTDKLNRSPYEDKKPS